MNNCFRRSGFVGFLGLLALHTLSAQAAGPTIEEHRVNGYRVILINTHQGNQMVTSVNVPTGSWHDDPVVHAGRAHLWEHVIFRSNARFDNGEREFQRLGTLSAGDSNAFTADGQTFFHVSGHPGAIDGALDFYGAMFSEPAWNEEHFQAERKVVMEEAAKYQQEDGVVLYSAAFTELLHPGHPLKMYDVGTQAQLAAMTLDDLKDLYFTNYTNRDVTLVIGGNFDTAENGVAPLDRQEILGRIARSFHSPVDPRPALHRPGVTTRSAERDFMRIGELNGVPQLRMIEVGTESDSRRMVIQLEIPRGMERERSEALETLRDYFNLQGPGSFTEELKKRGWATGIGAFNQGAQDYQWLTFALTLTEEGAANRHEIPALVLNAIAQVAARGVPEETLASLRQHNVRSYERALAQPAEAAEQLTKHLWRFDDAQRFFDLPARFGNVSSADLQRIARELRPIDSMLVTYMGPDVKSETKGQIFTNRSVARIEDPALLKKYVAAAQPGGAELFHLEPRIEKVALRFSRAPLKGPARPERLVPNLPAGTQAILKENHATQLGGLYLSARFPLHSARQEAALKVWWSAFRDRYSAELEYLGSEELVALGNSGVSGGAFLLLGGGDSLGSIQAFQWILERLRAFEPSEEELARALQGLAQAGDRDNQGFTAKWLNARVGELVSRGAYSTPSLAAASKGLTRDEVVRLARALTARADVTATLVGDHNEDRAHRLMASARAAFPKPLTENQRRRLDERSAPIARPTRAWAALPAVQKPGSMAQSRWYARVPNPSFEHTALEVFTETLSGRVFAVNRATKGLGYVHGAAMIPTRGQGSSLAVYGQTEGRERWGEIESGWDEVLAEVPARTLSDDGFQEAILGARRSTELLPLTTSGEAYHLQASYGATGVLDADQIKAQHLARMSTDDVYRVAEQVLGSPSLDVYATHGPKPSECRARLSSVRRIQRQIRK